MQRRRQLRGQTQHLAALHAPDDSRHVPDEGASSGADDAQYGLRSVNEGSAEGSARLSDDDSFALAPDGKAGDVQCTHTRQAARLARKSNKQSEIRALGMLGVVIGGSESRLASRHRAYSDRPVAPSIAMEVGVRVWCRDDAQGWVAAIVYRRDIIKGKSFLVLKPDER